MMKLPFFLIDAFTTRPFAGNPAAVVPLETPMADGVMQAMAAEQNLSETAFDHKDPKCAALATLPLIPRSTPPARRVEARHRGNAASDCAER